MIRRHHLPPLLALLLPLLVLRALLPAGYMPVVEQGSLRIVLCSAGIALPGDTGSGEDEPRATSSECPFAHASPAAPLVFFAATIAAPMAAAVVSPPPALTLPPSTGPPRAAGARAPPEL